MLKKTFKKGFTLIEMLVVILIIWILAVVLLPKLMGMVEGAKDLAPMSASRNLVASLTGTNYPPHLEEFSKKEYRIPNQSEMTNMYWIDDMMSAWGNWSWNVLWNPTEYKNADEESKSYKFGNDVLRQISEDLLAEQWTSRDDQTILLWFIWHLGKVVDGIEGGEKEGVVSALKKLFPYINQTDVANNKMDWAFYVWWLQKTEKSGSVKIDNVTFPDLIAINPELEGAYFNIFTYTKGWRILTLQDLFVDPYHKKAFIKRFLTMVNEKSQASIEGLSAWL